MLARNPRPPTESLYKTPVKIEVNSPVEGNLFTKMPDEEPEIKVRYVKRKLKTLKSIKPGMNEGEFSISVRIQNKGNVELENILVKEKIPKGFSLTEVSHEKYDLINLGDESEVRILIEELNGNETFNLNYNCSGTGEYPRYEPEVIVQGRETESAPTQHEGSGSSIQTVEGEVTAISEEKKAIINDLFAEIKKKIELTIPAEELGIIIENLRDQFPPGPVKHQLMQYAKDIKIQFKDKLVIGSFRDEVIEKLNEFKQKYS